MNNHEAHPQNLDGRIGHGFLFSGGYLAGELQNEFIPKLGYR